MPMLPLLLFAGVGIALVAAARRQKKAPPPLLPPAVTTPAPAPAPASPAPAPTLTPDQAFQSAYHAIASCDPARMRQTADSLAATLGAVLTEDLRRLADVYESLPPDAAQTLCNEIRHPTPNSPQVIEELANALEQSGAIAPEVASYLRNFATFMGASMEAERGAEPQVATFSPNVRF